MAGVLGGQSLLQLTGIFMVIILQMNELQLQQ